MFTIKQLSEITGKSENLIRQHIHRNHLESVKEKDIVYVQKEELLRWAKERNYKVNEQAIKDFEAFQVSLPSAVTNLEAKASRCKILLVEHGGELYFLGASVRVRRAYRAMKDSVWRIIETQIPNIILLQKDFIGDWKLEDFLASINGGTKILDFSFSGNISYESSYFVGHDHTSNHNNPPYNSPFSSSAVVYEYWDLNVEYKQKMLSVLAGMNCLKMLSEKFEVDFENYPDKIGNILIYNALDEYEVHLNKKSQKEFSLRLNKKPTDKLFAIVSCWLYEEPVYCRHLVVDQQVVTLELNADFNHFSCRLFDQNGNPIAMSKYYTIEEISLVMQAKGRTVQVQDKKGNKIANISKDMHQTSLISSDQIPSMIKDLLKWRNYEVRQSRYEKSGEYFDFNPEERNKLLKKVCELASEGRRGESTVYFCDPYFLKFINGDDGRMFLIRLVEALQGLNLCILCGLSDEILQMDPSKIVIKIKDEIPGNLLSGINIKALGQKYTGEKIRPRIHNRWIAHREYSYTISNSLNAINEDGATIQKMNSDFHYKKSEFFWSIKNDENSNEIFEYTF